MFLFLKLITCSGVNEHTDIEGLLKLLKRYRNAEIGIQVNEKKCNFNSDRMTWIRTLYNVLRARGQKINAALHVNPSWVEDFGQGYLAPELQNLMSMRNVEGDPFFQRIQLNFKIGRDRTPDLYKMFGLMQLYKTRRFILSYNDNNAEFIGKMYKLAKDFGIVFDLLYDDSHGEGIVPKERKAPVFEDIRQGYAGGIGPENVYSVLENIKKNLPDKYMAGVTIDAEGRLKGDRHRIDLNRCASYLEEVAQWSSEQKW